LRLSTFNKVYDDDDDDDDDDYRRAFDLNIRLLAQEHIAWSCYMKVK